MGVINTTWYYKKRLEYILAGQVDNDEIVALVDELLEELNFYQLASNIVLFEDCKTTDEKLKKLETELKKTLKKEGEMTSCKNCAFWKEMQEDVGEYIYLNIFRCSNELLKEQLCKYNYSLYTQIKEEDNCSLFIRVGDIVWERRFKMTDKLKLFYYNIIGFLFDKYTKFLQKFMKRYFKKNLEKLYHKRIWLYTRVIHKEYHIEKKKTNIGLEDFLKKYKKEN